VSSYCVWCCGDATYSFQRNRLRKDLSVIGFGLIGWIAPSSLALINGNSLFFDIIGPELAHFSTGPTLTSPFWYVTGSLCVELGLSEVESVIFVLLFSRSCLFRFTDLEVLQPMVCVVQVVVGDVAHGIVCGTDSRPDRVQGTPRWLPVRILRGGGFSHGSF
jgi:photosystem I protein PsaO